MARGEAGRPPIPTVPALDQIIATGTPDERRAAIRAFNEALVEFFKKAGVIAGG